MLIKSFKTFALVSAVSISICSFSYASITVGPGNGVPAVGGGTSSGGTNPGGGGLPPLNGGGSSGGTTPPSGGGLPPLNDGGGTSGGTTPTGGLPDLNNGTTAASWRTLMNNIQTHGGGGSNSQNAAAIINSAITNNTNAANKGASLIINKDQSAFDTTKSHTNEVANKTQKNTKWLVINYFSTENCDGCYEQIQYLNKFAKKYKSVNVVGISADDLQSDELDAAAKKMGIQYGVFELPAGATGASQFPQSINGNVIYDPDDAEVYNYAPTILNTSPSLGRAGDKFFPVTFILNPNLEAVDVLFGVKTTEQIAHALNKAKQKDRPQAMIKKNGEIYIVN